LPSGNKFKIENQNWIDLTDGEIIKIGNCKLEIIFTPGHADDHICLNLDNEVIFSGDNVLGGSTAVFDNYAAYMNSLNKMKQTIERIGGKIPIYPGHGDVIDDGLDRIDFYIQHRLERENQILNNLGLTTFKPNRT